MLNKVYSNARRSPPLAPRAQHEKIYLMTLTIDSDPSRTSCPCCSSSQAIQGNFRADAPGCCRNWCRTWGCAAKTMGEAFLGLSFEQLGLIPSGND